MAEKRGVSPLVLFKGLTGDGQEVAHGELRLGVCGAAREGRRRVRWRTPGTGSNPAQPLWESASLPNAPPPPTRGSCSNERPRRGFISFNIVCCPAPDYRYQHIHRGTRSSTATCSSTRCRGAHAASRFGQNRPFVNGNYFSGFRHEELV